MKPGLAVIILFLFALSVAAWGNNGGKRIKLADVDALTFYHAKMTKGQRSSPVPQLECINEGTAPCSAFHPKAVQCINRGSDGYDVQWECKSDMDNSFRFGEIDVSCEGYDYPDDPYILYGSCGLKYSLDYTQERLHRQKTYDYSSDSHQYYNSHTSKKSKSTTSNIIADLIVYISMGLIVYALYKTCTGARRHQGESAYSSTDDDYPSGGGGGGYGWFGGGQPPPSYSSYENASCRNRNSGYNGTRAGGFWTGAATWGLLGYMFGNRSREWGGGNSTWRGGFPSSGASFHSSSSGSSSGMQTVSGFGGTSRR